MGFVLLGPIVGAFVLTLIPELLRFLKGNEPIFTGALIILIVIFLPQGLLGLFASLSDNQTLGRLLDRLFPGRAKRRQVDREEPPGVFAGSAARMRPPRWGTNMTAILEISKLTKRFGGVSAVNDLDMVVNEGEILGLIGPNGAGKSTVFSMIGGFQPPSGGKILYQGRDITGMQAHNVARLGIARVFAAVTDFRQALGARQRLCRLPQGVSHP